LVERNIPANFPPIDEGDASMNVSLPLDQMSTAEKLITLESLWDDLCRHADEIPSPSWHKKILDDRESRLRRGVEGVTDWETAKQKIRESLS
jgi:hypothetical protein